jgi:hypothetical protein
MALPFWPLRSLPPTTLGVSNPEQTGSGSCRRLLPTSRSNPRKESAHGPDQKPTLSPKTAPDRNAVQRTPAILAGPSSCPSYHLVAGAGGRGVLYPGVSRAVAIWCGPTGLNRPSATPSHPTERPSQMTWPFCWVRILLSQCHFKDRGAAISKALSQRSVFRQRRHDAKLRYREPRLDNRPSLKTGSLLHFSIESTPLSRPWLGFAASHPLPRWSRSWTALISN